MIKKWYDSYIIICEFEVFCSGMWILYEAENCTLVISAQQQQLRWYLWVNQYTHIKQTIMKKRTPFNKLTPCNYPSVWINILNEYQRWKQKYHILVNELFSVCFSELSKWPERSFKQVMRKISNTAGISVRRVHGKERIVMNNSNLSVHAAWW